MPLPKPNKTEKRNEFITRCVQSDVMQSEYKNNEQRVAICNKQYDNQKQQLRKLKNEIREIVIDVLIEHKIL